MFYALSQRRSSISPLSHLHLIPSSPFITPWFSSLHHQPCPKFSHSLSTHNGIPDFFDHLLQQCTSARMCTQVHAQIITFGSHDSPFLAARTVSSYARYGFLAYAKRVFETTPSECTSNLLLWNSILRAHASHGDCFERLKLYVRMRKLGVKADGFTFPLVIRACAKMGSANLCRALHGHVMHVGFQFELHTMNELVGMYAKLRRMNDARRVFDRMLCRNHISWNTMVSGYARDYDRDGAVHIFRRMESEGLEPNIITWTSLFSSHKRCGFHEETIELFDRMRHTGIGATAEALAVVLSACADSARIKEGLVIHGFAFKGGFECYEVVKNSLICVYGKCGFMLEARKLFLEVKEKSIASWNALISSYAESGFCDEAFAVFSGMDNSDDHPVVRPNVISWSAVINGFASSGRGKESLQLFRQMQLANVMSNCVTLESVLSVCAEFPAPSLGKEIHGHVVRVWMDDSNLVGNGLINMYTKCGSLKEARKVFDNFGSKDISSWNAMIKGYGMHGRGELSLTTFEQMIEAGRMPDKVTFVAVLSACSHAGLVAEGRKHFDEMTTEFGIKPQVEHYACMVDLLGRAGHLQEASDIVKTMPMEPNACVWGALLNSCRMHRNTEIAERTASEIFSLAAETGSYMLLSNVYAARGRWEDSARVRISAKTKGLKKIPGQSWIEVNKKVNTFSAGKVAQKGLEEVLRILKDLTFQMKNEGYLPNSSFGLEDDECNDIIWDEQGVGYQNSEEFSTN